MQLQSVETLRRRSIPVVGKIWQRLGNMPLPPTEESILLRIFVQGLVAVGVIATDVAADTQLSLWAIPLSCVGAIWSWYRRRKRNVMVKFFLVIGMLLAMASFFGNLFSSLNDTRLVLAELLIQLQVLHSFDLPRRKDLGYSMVIGLILLGVAGTVSQTLAFAPLLLLFLVLALPVLVLDYRSRLGLVTEKKRRKNSSRENLEEGDNQLSLSRLKSSLFVILSPQRWLFFLGTILVLGLTIFLLMPRFPGYQLQSFPVSAPVDLDNQSFEQQNQGIVNPGYGNQENGEAEGRGSGETEGPGEVDDTFYYGFNSQINQNLRGEMTPKVVLRIRSQAPGFWRVMAFDRYTGKGWQISREDKLIQIERPSWSYQFYLSPPRTTAPTKQVIQSYTTVAELPNIIPALSYPKQLYFPAKQVAVDLEGSLRSPLGLLEGLTYTVISEVPIRDRTLLRKASEEYPEKVEEYYLQIPPEILTKVKQRTEELLAKSPNPLTSSYEKALHLAQAVKQNYEVKTDLPFFDEDEDLVEAFLFRHQGGYPDHFATAYTMMLRSVGIPARLEVGFATGEFNPFTGLYVVKNTDAHALTEVYFGDYGWYAFDPIPGHEIIPPSVEEVETFGALQQFWRWLAGWLPSPVSNFFGELWQQVIARIVRSIAWLWRFFSSSWVGLFTGIMTAIGFSFLAWLSWNQLQAWAQRRWLAKLAPMERLYQQMLTLATEQGYPKSPAQTPLEYAQDIQGNWQGARTEIVEEICQGYVGWRYGDKSQNFPYLQGQLQALRRSLRRIN